MENVIVNAIGLMKSLTEYYGAEEGQKFWNSIQDILPEEVSHGILIELLANVDLATRITLKSVNSTNKVQTIKAIRYASNVGLKEAMDIYNIVDSGKEYNIKIAEGVNYATAKHELSVSGFVL